MQIVVSIIIPHFNRSLLLKHTVDSVLAQTYKNWEIIIVDDGSDVGEFNAVKEYATIPNISVVLRQNGIKGPSACRNIGAKMAVGKYLIFLDSDDLLASYCLEQRVRFMEENKGMSMAVFLQKNFSIIPGDTKDYFNVMLPESALTGAFIENNNPWQTMAPIWDKCFFTAIGGFDESLLFMEDPELHIRALCNTEIVLSICYNMPADCFYRINNMDSTKKEFYYNSVYYRILFYKKMIALYKAKSFLQDNAGHIKAGIYGIAKCFLYSRKNEFPQLFSSYKALLKDADVFSFFERKKLDVLMSLGNYECFICRILKVRGICYRILFKGYK